MTTTLKPKRKPRATPAEMAQRRAAAATRSANRKPLSEQFLTPGAIQEKHALYAERLAAWKRSPTTNAHPGGRISNLGTKGKYDGRELLASAVRIGADDFLVLPSRIGNTLHYRDGRKVAL